MADTLREMRIDHARLSLRIALLAMVADSWLGGADFRLLCDRRYVFSGCLLVELESAALTLGVPPGNLEWARRRVDEEFGSDARVAELLDRQLSHDTRIECLLDPNAPAG